MLLVVVDEPGVRRGRDHAVVGAAELEPARVAVDDLRGPPRRAHAGEGLDPRQRVERVAAQEVRGGLHRPARPLVLVTPVGRALGGAREVEVEVRRPPRRSGCPGEHDAQDVGVLVLRNHRSERQQLAGGARREPPSDVRALPFGRCLERVESSHHLPQLALEHEGVVALRLDPHQERVERGDVDPARVEAALERLHERRPGAGERIEDMSARPEVASEQRLDELRDELAQVRMKPVDVLRPLALGQVALGPRELEVDVAVERILGRGHAPPEFYGTAGTPRTTSSRMAPPPSGASSASSKTGLYPHSRTIRRTGCAGTPRRGLP